MFESKPSFTICLPSVSSEFLLISFPFPFSPYLKGKTTPVQHLTFHKFAIQNPARRAVPVFLHQNCETIYQSNTPNAHTCIPPLLDHSPCCSLSLSPSSSSSSSSTELRSVMFRPGFTSSTLSHTRKESWARLLASLALWISVCISLRYGYYGSSQMVLGPSSSRLLTASPVFVKQIQVKEEAKKGVFIYGFQQRPQLSLETNWTVIKYLIVGSYSHQGFSLWMNKGSRIRMRWEAPSASLSNLRISIIKGEREFQTLMPKSSSSSYNTSASKQIGGEEADYAILEDDKYYVSVVNTNPRSVIMTMTVDVSSKMYDTTNSSSVCSTMNGSCKLNLLFPSTRYVILTTPNNADLLGWYVELSFVSRIVTYVAILGLVVIMIFLILKYLGACNNENEVEESSTTTHEIFVPARVEQSESDPLMPEKPVKFTYGTGDEDPEAGSSGGSSDELYDGKICVICYDEPRNCFFVPCGHCATCYECALRVLEGESRACPICRRLIHKVRKLFTS